MFHEEFNELETVEFQLKMKPFAIQIYQRVFPGCWVEDLRENGVNVHVLDKEFAIDSLINMKSGQWISLQEKYRRNYYLIKHGDFTQEYMNAVGTKHENPGEWFKLGAQLYFYGWATHDESDFQKWFIMDISRYKLAIEKAGGLNKVGRLIPNKKHGRANFYAIPIKKISHCFVADYRDYLEIP